MKVNRTLLSVLNSIWLIDPAAGRSYLPIVSNLIKGQVVLEQPETPSVTFTCISNIEGQPLVVEQQVPLSEARSRAQSISSDNGLTDVMVQIHGPIMKHDAFCGPSGSMTNAAIISSLSNNPNVGTIFIDIDSPGGMVDGTQTLVKAINDSPKHTVAVINDGMACSAGYWIAAAADEVYVTQKTDVVGSIGVYTTLYDYKAWMESEGMPVKDIYSARSTEKNKTYNDALDSTEGEAGLRTQLDFIADEFIGFVKANRTINTESADPTKGAVFYAEQALEIGLIDGIKSMDEILSLGKSNQDSAQAHAVTTKGIDEVSAPVVEQAVEETVVEETVVEETVVEETVVEEQVVEEQVVEEQVVEEQVVEEQVVEDTAISDLEATVADLESRLATAMKTTPAIAATHLTDINENVQDGQEDFEKRYPFTAQNFK